jgi:hypothetical protein
MVLSWCVKRRSRRCANLGCWSRVVARYPFGRSNFILWTMTEGASEITELSPTDALNASEPLSREQLYETVWQEPMLRIAARLGVSSSYMARVCTELRVPRPQRGYWAQLEVGKAPDRPALPPARPGDVVVWKVGGAFTTSQPMVAQAARTPEVLTIPRFRKPALDRPHELLAGVKPVFLKTRTNGEDGLLRPFKRLLVDIVVSEATLDGALDFANRLFQSLEAKGHRVVFAPANTRIRRAEFDVREAAPKTHYYPRTWSPDRSTVVYVGAVPIGLTLFEVTESIEAVYVKGDYIPVRTLTAEQLRRYKEPYNWRTHKDYASGRLCLQAYSPDWRAPWTKQWREGKPSQLAAQIPQIVREVEGAAPELAARIVEAETKAEAERIVWEAQRQREREEAERARRVKARQDAKQDILSAIAGWDQAMRIHAFFAAAEGAIRGLSEEEQHLVSGRLQEARTLIGEVDPLALLKRWRTPEER